MSPPLERFLRLAPRILLRFASFLVPSAQRAEWLREWRAELWHVRAACAPTGPVTWNGQRPILDFALGAFPDAFCLRRDASPAESSSTPLESPERCILFLAAVLTSCLAAALLFPGVRAVLSLAPPPPRPGLVLIHPVGENYGLQPTFSFAQYSAWKRARQRYFDGFAFYQAAEETVDRDSDSNRLPAKWQIARASSNLFALLGTPVRFPLRASDPGAAIPQIILSQRLWKKEFAADPHVTGTILRLAGRPVRIAGVAPDASLGLPGNIAAWLLQPASEPRLAGRGYVIAHLTPAGQAEMWAQCVRITAFGPSDTENDLFGVALGTESPGPWAVFLFTAFLAFLCLPATTSVSLGDYAVCSQKPSWPRRLYRWAFLGAKIALILPIVYFASLDLAYGRTAFTSTTSEYIQLLASFSLSLCALNWALRDQRQRCPVCLRRVAHPAQVGQASRTFLAWNGTELICMGGHTMLHVPGLPTSWFSTQRWLYLDNSWSFLFPDSTSALKEDLLTGMSAQ